MARVLVTGGSGFLGEHVVGALVERGLEVAVLARGAAESLKALGVEVVPGDVVRDLDLPGGGAPRGRARGGGALRPSLKTALAAATPSSTWRGSSRAIPRTASG